MHFHSRKWEKKKKEKKKNEAWESLLLVFKVNTLTNLLVSEIVKISNALFFKWKLMTTGWQIHWVWWGGQTEVGGAEEFSKGYEQLY